MLMHPLTEWLEGFHCWSVFSGVSDFPEDIFTLEQKRHGAVLLHVLCVSRRKDEMIITFTRTCRKSTLSNAVPLLFTGYLHVSSAGYRMWRLLCAITGKIIRGMTSVLIVSVTEGVLKVFVHRLEPPSQSGCSRCNLYGSWELRPWALHLFDRSVRCLCNQSTVL